ncbi:MAG: hypothetical protein WCB71_09045, partial [Aestuariivirga sp.]
AIRTLAAASTTTTITETIPAGYVLASATCSGMGGGGTATPNLATGALVLNAAATAAGSNIACTFTNTKLPTITLTKISNGAVGGFTFTGTNGWASQTITTVTSGVGVAGATQTLAAASTATTITETIPAGYVLASATCSGMGGGGTATPNLATGALVLNAAATAAGSNIACTFTNAAPSFAITKAVNLANITGPTTLSYTITIQNTGSATLTGLSISDVLVQGANPRTLASGPAYSSGDADSDGAIDPAETWIYTATYAVTQANIDDGSAFSNTATFDTAETAPLVSNAATTTITQSPALTLEKTADTVGPVSAADIINYTYKVKNTGNITISGVTLAETFNGYGTAPVPANETLSLDAAPAGDSTTGTANDGIWAVLAPGDEVTFTAPYAVVQQDVDFLQ